MGTIATICSAAGFSKDQSGSVSGKHNQNGLSSTCTTDTGTSLQDSSIDNNSSRPVGKLAVNDNNNTIRERGVSMSIGSGNNSAASTQLLNGNSNSTRKTPSDALGVSQFEV